MNKNIFYLNKKKKLNNNNLDRFDSKEIGVVLSSNPYLLMKYWTFLEIKW